MCSHSANNTAPQKWNAFVWRWLLIHPHVPRQTWWQDTSVELSVKYKITSNAVSKSAQLHAQILRPTMISFISKNLAGPAFRPVLLHSNNFAWM